MSPEKECRMNVYEEGKNTYGELIHHIIICTQQQAPRFHITRLYESVFTN